MTTSDIRETMTKNFGLLAANYLLHYVLCLVSAPAIISTSLAVVFVVININDYFLLTPLINNFTPISYIPNFSWEPKEIIDFFALFSLALLVLKEIYKFIISSVFKAKLPRNKFSIPWLITVIFLLAAATIPIMNTLGNRLFFLWLIIGAYIMAMLSFQLHRLIKFFGRNVLVALEKEQ